ncbi:MAG: uroporphyrinogen-III C-methyltransferase [Burkholderiales bacterium]
MTDPALTSSSTSTPPGLQTAVLPGRRLGPAFLIAAAVVLVLLVAGIWLDTRSQIGGLQRELVQKLAAAEQFNKDSRLLADQTREAFRALDLKVSTLESRFAETQNQRLALESLYTELSRSRDERVLAEIEQMLVIASQQLKLARNLKAALVALENADSRLQRADSTQFTRVRRAIQSDLERLKSAPSADIVGMALRIENIANQVEMWPLAMHERPAVQAPPPAGPKDSAFTRFVREFWHDARNLVRIERVSRPEIPLLAPAQSFFLRENLKIRLLSARVSLSSQDEANYKSDLREASQWIRRYFDAKDKKVALALSTLEQLNASDVSIELPGIHASLEAVHQDKLARERGIR